MPANRPRRRQIPESLLYDHIEPHQDGLYVILLSRIPDDHSRVTTKITRVTDIARSVNRLNLKIARALRRHESMSTTHNIESVFWKIEAVIGRVRHAKAIKHAWTKGKHRGLRDKTRVAFEIALGLDHDTQTLVQPPATLSWNYSGNLAQMIAAERM